MPMSEVTAAQGRPALRESSARMSTLCSNLMHFAAFWFSQAMQGKTEAAPPAKSLDADGVWEGFSLWKLTS